MSKGWKIALGCLVAGVAVLSLIGWGAWAAVGGKAGWYSLLADMSSADEAKLEHLRQAVEIRGDDARLQSKLGDALAKAGDDEGAIQAWEQAAALDTDDPKPLLALARLRLRSGDFGAAIEAANQALERKRGLADAHLVLGEAYVASGDNERAVDELKTAQRLGASDRSVCYHLGQAYEGLGQRDRAIEAYEQGAGTCDSRCKDRLAELGVSPWAEKQAQASRPEEQDYEPEEYEEGPPGAFLVGMVLLWIGFYGVIIITVLAGWVAGILVLWDCAHRDFSHPNLRALWTILVFAMHFMGALIYYFAVYRPNDPPRMRTS